MKRIIILIFLIYSSSSIAQDSTLVISHDMFNENGEISLATKGAWLFKAGRDSTYTKANAKEWIELKPAAITEKLADENGKFEGWFRIKIKLNETFKDSLVGLNFSHKSWTPMDLFINGNLLKSYGQTGLDGAVFKTYKHNNNKAYDFVNIETDKTYNILLFVTDKTNVLDGRLIASMANLSNFIVLGNSRIGLKDTGQSSSVFFSTLLGVLTFLFWALYFLNKREKQLLYPSVTITFMFLASAVILLINLWTLMPYTIFRISIGIASICSHGFLFSIPLTLGIIFKNTIPKTIWISSGVFFALSVIAGLFFTGIGFIILAFGIVYLIIVLVYYLLKSWKTLNGPKRAFVIGIGILLLLLSVMLAFLNMVSESSQDIVNFISPLALLSFPISLFVYILLWLKESRKEKEKNVDELIKITQEKKDLLENQNEVLEQQVNERTTELNQSLQYLKSTQSQLIQSEKMASLGELTAGIAHEIQNPLNFVNNFSEVSKELLDEMLEEIENGDMEEAKAIMSDVVQNLEKINHHGKRADSIVKGMLQHSRTSGNKKEATDINALADEYLRLAYHGLRAKDKSFNATLETDYDENLKKIDIIPQDIGRVILNLITNAFYAVNEKFSFAKTSQDKEYEPTVTLTTKKSGTLVSISVKDNGNGIPKHVLDKIFQPFFTTKPTGEGTGLGLSMSYDIAKAHGGELNVETKEGEGTTFIITIPNIN